MAKDKKTILVYADWIAIFEKLEDGESGKLIKHFFRYVNDLNPEPPDRLTELLFEPIKITLKRDLKKWEQEIENQSKAGRLGNLKRYNPDLYDKVNKGEITLEDAEAIAIDRKVSQPDKKVSQPDSDPTKNVANLADSVSDNDTVNDKEESKPKKTGLPPKKDYSFIDSIIKEFTESYFSVKNMPYEVITIGKERKAAGTIIKMHRRKFPGYSSEQSLKALRLYFDTCNGIDDKWLSNNMSLSIIVDKFNEINNLIINGNKRKTNQPATSDRELAELTAKHFATDYQRE